MPPVTEHPWLGGAKQSTPGLVLEFWKRMEAFSEPYTAPAIAKNVGSVGSRRARLDSPRGGLQMGGMGVSEIPDYTSKYRIISRLNAFLGSRRLLKNPPSATICNYLRR
jgi:hypothetical protein